MTRRDKHEPIPPERSATIPSLIREALSAEPKTARDLSQELGVSEREVLRHLQHLERSLKDDQARLVVEPPACLACGFVFRKRERLDRPSRCPVCRSERLSSARFRVAPRATNPDRINARSGQERP
jgi:predicted Zn-ribbon and HTH transcriptional regulator